MAQQPDLAPATQGGTSADSRLSDWQADKRRCGHRHPLLREQSMWAIGVYRFGRRVEAMDRGLRKSLLTKLYWLAYRLTETITGIGLSKDVVVGPGLRIWHFGGIFISPGVVIGANCTLRQGVTIGNRVEGGPVPRLGDDVNVGAYAQIIGDVKIGDGCQIGAMAVVLSDVPAGRSAVGNPARIV